MKEIYLPLIDDEIYNEFIDTDLITDTLDRSGKPEWSQIAVDFVYLLNRVMQEK